MLTAREGAWLRTSQTGASVKDWGLQTVSRRPAYGLQVTKDTSFRELLEANPWMKTTKLVVKPDMLFGKRGKHDLVGLNLDVSGVETFVNARLGKARPCWPCSAPKRVLNSPPRLPHASKPALT